MLPATAQKNTSLKTIEHVQHQEKPATAQSCVNRLAAVQKLPLPVVEADENELVLIWTRNGSPEEIETIPPSDVSLATSNPDP